MSQYAMTLDLAHGRLWIAKNRWLIPLRRLLCEPRSINEIK